MQLSFLLQRYIGLKSRVFFHLMLSLIHSLLQGGISIQVREYSSDIGAINFLIARVQKELSRARVVVERAFGILKGRL